MAPEQIVPTKDAPIDRRSDVFSLGIIFFELLTLHHPFDGVSRELRAQSIVRDEPLSLRSIGVSLGRDLEIVLRTALEKDRRRRYATAAEFADDIERALRKEPIRARRAGALLRATRWVQRNRTVAALLFMIVSTVGFAAVNAFLSSTRYRMLYESLLEEKRESRTTRIARAIDAGALASIRGRWTDAVAAYDEAESLGSEDFVTLGRGRVRAYLGRLDLAAARAEILRLRQKFGSANFPGPLRLLEIETDRETAVDPELMRSRLKSLMAEGSLGPNDRAYVEARVAEDLEESRLLLEGVLATDPWHQEAERYLAGVLAALGDGERLSALTIAASARRPEDPFCVVLRATKAAISGDCSAASSIMHELRGRVQTKELLIAESEVLSFAVPAALVDFALRATGVVDNTEEKRTAELTAACQVLDDVAGPPEVDAVLVREWSHLIRRAVFAPMIRFEELRAGKAIAPLASVATEFATSTRRLHNSAALALAAFYQSEDEVGLERSLALARESGQRPPVGRSRTLADMMAINALGALFVSATTRAPGKADAYLAQFPEAIRRYLAEKTGRCPVGIGTTMLRMAVRADDLDGALRFDAEWQKDGASVEQRLIEAERAASKPGEIRRIFALVVAARILAEDPKNLRAVALRTRLMSEGAASAPSSSTDR